MSAQEIRNEIIRENLPKLIKELTGFDADDENTRRCEQFAWSIIRNHRNLSTNSHEVRRKIEGIQEKFNVDNCAEYAEHLGRMCDEIIQHPLCVEHYEVDVQWSMLDLLLTLAYNPTGALRQNKQEIDYNLQKAAVNDEDTQQQTETEYLKSVLKQDFIPLTNFSGSDSDLSDWSDAAIDVHTSTESNSSEPKDAHKCAKNVVVLPGLPPLKPPEKSQPFQVFDNAGIKEQLFNSYQHTWWLPNAKHMQAQIESRRVEANFATLYSRYLSETSNNLISFEEPSTATEYCLIREMLWMFHSPQDCKFFNVHGSEIKMRDNVTIPSVTVTGLITFVEQNFLPHICMMSTLRSFLDAVYMCEDFMPPKTIECYAANLRLLMEPIWQDLIDYETRLLAQRDFEITTLIHMQYALRQTFKKLTQIYELHQSVALNLGQYPAHISSAFLLASLMHCNQVACNASEANLAMSLLLTSMKVFCVIIDTWWSEGRLDDWQQEFIVERVNDSDQSICVRPFHKDKERGFFLPTSISKIITENRLFRLLREHSLEAGCTLNLLYEINRISDLRNACAAIKGKLYNVFIDDVLTRVRTLQTEFETPTKVQPNDDSGYANETVDAVQQQLQTTLSLLDTHLELHQSLSTTDEFLRLAFTANFEDESKDACDSSALATAAIAANAGVQEPNALTIFNQLEKCQHDLPLEELILNSLKRILKTRIAFANSFVMQMYRDEFVILKHLRNIRKVLLLESSDLMHQFYNDLFQQIENGANWANTYTLTTQLDDIICAKFPDMSGLFRFEINSTFRCQTKKVFEAVDELIVNYNFSRELAHIITEHDIQQYNQVFRFLLKVKWGLITLENLQFPRTHKRRTPYAPFEMTDLLMRRLEQLRFWMIYAIQSIHFHLMTHVLQSMGEQLDTKISNCTNLKEMKMVHKSYVSTVCEHCFLVESFHAIKMGIEQLLNLAHILRLEWNSCIKYIENNSPLGIELSDSENEDTDSDYVANSQIDAIELTYIRCHQYLANKLNNEVYLQQRTFLSGLSAAFNTSLPY